MSRPLWFVKLIKQGFPYRFRLARLTRVPFLGRWIERALFHGDRLYYLPHETAITVNRSLQHPVSITLPEEIVEYFIKQTHDLWIMNKCICRDASQCRAYPINYGCLFLGKAIYKIHPELGRKVSQAEALAYAVKCREAGLIHLIGRNRLDTVWLGTGPGQELLTICHCCPCCCLWKMLPNLPARIESRVSGLPGLKPVVTERCTGCGQCANDICFVDAIQIQNGKAQIADHCKGCGRCVRVCPEQAIELKIGPEALEEVQSRIASLVHLEDSWASW